MPTVISLFAKKGGVGKTTLTLNLAGYLASQNHRVLLIDADHQASLSQGLLGPDKVERLSKRETLAALFDEVNEPDPRSIVHETGCENIWIAPASDLLQPYALPNPMEAGPLQFAFRDFIGEVAGNVDFVICDTPPDCANLLAWNCLMASNYVISPVEMETYSAQSVAGVIRKLDDACTHGNSRLQSLGYIINIRDKRLSLHAANEKKFRQLYGSQVFKTVIFDWIAISEAEHKKTHIFNYAPDSEAAKTIAAFGKELLQRAEQIVCGRAA